jgi:hypothetical protein
VKEEDGKGGSRTHGFIQLRGKWKEGDRLRIMLEQFSKKKKSDKLYAEHKKERRIRTKLLGCPDR